MLIVKQILKKNEQTENKNPVAFTSKSQNPHKIGKQLPANWFSNGPVRFWRIHAQHQHDLALQTMHHICKLFRSVLVARGASTFYQEYLICDLGCVYCNRMQITYLLATLLSFSIRLYPNPLPTEISPHQPINKYGR